MTTVNIKSQMDQPSIEHIHDEGDVKYWIRNLQIGDYVDASVYNDRRKVWEDYQICKVTSQNQEGIHLRGCCIQYLWLQSSTWKREIDFKFENEKFVKIAALNTYTAFHSFLTNPALEECDVGDFGSGAGNCHKCGKYCCIKCALIVLNATIYSEKYECAQCNEQKRFDALYTILVNAFDESANGKALLDEYIISDIVQFSIGFIVKCKNVLDRVLGTSCSNEICFKNEISMFNELDADNKRITVIERERISVKAHGAMTNALFKDDEESDSDSEEEVKEEDMMNGDVIWNKCGGVFCSECTYRKQPRKRRLRSAVIDPIQPMFDLSSSDSSSWPVRLFGDSSSDSESSNN